jgi:hypothetical protein
MQEAKLAENAVARPATAKPARTPRQTPTPSLAGTSPCEGPSFEPAHIVATARCFGRQCFSCDDFL